MNQRYYGIPPFGACPNERQLAHFDISKKAFFHFGVNTFTNAEWGNGTEAEKVFDPKGLDIRQWMRSIKAAGFGLAIITAKHHDGFCLWPSEYTEHSIKNSPYKNGKGDIIREFTDAAREYGIKAGVYISPWDRNSPYWGKPEYSEYYAKQLTELMQNYGEFYEVWWDGAGSTETVYDWGNWAYIIRENQPKAAIFGSMGATDYVDLRWVGNERGFAGETHYACIDDIYLRKETPARLNVGDPGASRYIPSETDVSIRPGWFYHADQDDKVKTVNELCDIWFRSVGRNSMLLLNFPPDRNGLLCEPDVSNAIKAERLIKHMLSVNLASDAEVTADSVYCAATSPDKAVLDDKELFYAAAEDARTCVLDVKLPEKRLINAFTFGEFIRLGERITSFTVSGFGEDGSEKLLFSGTSVGNLRAARFEKGYYDRFVFRVTGALAAPLISRLGLHLFEDKAENGERADKKTELTSLPTASVSLSDDRKTAEISFGGIYDFGKVAFRLASPGNADVYAFNGQSYELVYTGISDGNVFAADMPKTIEGSYRIKIVSDTVFADEPGFSVR